MVQSTAPEGSFLFAQHVDGDWCHLSLCSSENPTINLKIPIQQVYRTIENLTRVLEYSRLSWIEKAHSAPLQSNRSYPMMYCVNCDYPITRQELDNRKCSHCGNDPAKDLSRRVHRVGDPKPDPPKQQEPPRDS